MLYIWLLLPNSLLAFSVYTWHGTCQSSFFFIPLQQKKSCDFFISSKTNFESDSTTQQMPLDRCHLFMFFIISYKDQYLPYQTQCMIPSMETVLTFLSILSFSRAADSLPLTIMGQLLRTCWCQQNEFHRAALASMVTATTRLATCNLYMWANWAQSCFWRTWLF